MKKNCYSAMIDNKRCRDQWVEAQLASIPAGQAILDAGAGEMPYKRYCSHLRYTSQDFGKYDGLGNHKGLQTTSFDSRTVDIISDITEIPVGDESFDVILCTEVLEHVPDPISTLRELTRLLKKGGTLILSAPFASITHFAPFHYCTGFSEYFYRYHLSSFRMNHIRIEKNGNYFSYLSQELERLPSVVHQYCPRSMVLTTLIKILTRPALYLIKVIAERSSDSDDLLYFGCHVIATKNLS